VEGSASDGFERRFIDRAHRVIAGVPADQSIIELLSPLVAAGQEGQVDACHVLLNSNAFLFVE
jgi:hypothetical protein